MINIDQIKQLREETSISISECKKALEESGGDSEKAKQILREWGKDVAQKKQERETGEGLVEGYLHQTGRVGSLVAVRCETDFVARSDEFKNLCHELAMQVAFAEPDDVESFLGQEYIKDSARTVGDMVNEYIAKLGENIVIERFVRFHI